MKKIVGLLYMIVMLLSISAFAEDTFTLHNGITFGMTADEVIQQEQAAGFEYTVDNQSARKLIIIGKVAGYDETSINYIFADDGTLSCMQYTFHNGNQSSVYQAMENTLAKKYGKAEYGSLTGLSLPEFTANGKLYSRDFSTGESVISNGNRPVFSCEYSQRIVPISETEYVYIECKYWDRIYLFDHRHEEVVISYQLLDAETVQSIMGDISQLDNDL